MKSWKNNIKFKNLPKNKKIAIKEWESNLIEKTHWRLNCKETQQKKILNKINSNQKNKDQVWKIKKNERRVKLETICNFIAF
jgi:hypothetical protein